MLSSFVRKIPYFYLRKNQEKFHTLLEEKGYLISNSTYKHPILLRKTNKVALLVGSDP